MAEEEALGGDSDLWVSSRGSEVVLEACSEKGIQGKSQLPTRRTSTSQAVYRADISWDPVLSTPLGPARTRGTQTPSPATPLQCPHCSMWVTPWSLCLCYSLLLTCRFPVPQRKTSLCSCTCPAIRLFGSRMLPALRSCCPEPLDDFASSRALPAGPEAKARGGRYLWWGSHGGHPPCV